MAMTQADFARLVAAHSEPLYRMAYRLVGDAHQAEDVVQETFRAAWGSRAQYDPTRGDRAWLATILRRRAADHWRRGGRWRVMAEHDDQEPLTHDADLLDAGYTDPMQRALDQLPHDWRDALLLVVVGELTHQEAADVLGIPLGTALSRVSRARDKLRRLLTETARPT